ncbi:hypothetical protein RF641_07670 [Arthrobacter sp. LS16]|uniref:hypothetical protein n=1 Tax=Arthrobacter sp. 'calajunan' TaxID=1690248 RepID=UPI003C791771
MITRLLSTTAIAVTFLTFNVGASPALELPDCERDKVSMKGEDASHICDETKMIQIDEWHIESPENKYKPIDGPRYKIRDYDPCVLGRQEILGCDANPDLPQCDDGSYPISRQIFDLDGNLLRDLSYCPGDPPAIRIPDDQIIKEIIISPNKFRTFPIKASKLSSDPNGFTLRNGNTHFWASHDSQEFNSNLSGADVKIRAIPVQWNWNYGDGTTRKLHSSGQPSPEHTLHDETPTSHIFEETGKFSVGVTTLYRGEFSVDGGPWQSIPGQAAVPSTPITMDVWRTKKELIANE